MEALISSCQEQLAFSIAHASDVAAVRRAAQSLAEQLDFDDVRAGRVAIIVTEAATNILKHAGSGTVHVMRAQTGADMRGIDIIAVDGGPGIANLDESFRDGVSTVNTAGTGLGALRRQADEFDVWTAHGQGAAFFMRVWRGPAPPEPCGVEFGALTVPLAGEDACGDGWAVHCDLDGAVLLGVDGLGHGPEAAKAACAAVESLDRRPNDAPADALQAAHMALRPTRGAALSIARIDYASGDVRFAGIGNVFGTVADGGARRALVSHNGIVGHNVRKVQEFAVPYTPGALVVLHSDGIQTQWNLADYPGLQARTPALVAAVMMRDFVRGRDDAMVLVARRRGGHA